MVIFFVFILSSEPFQNLIRGASGLGYLGAFLSGIFFVSIFTVAPASVILFDIANVHNPIIVAVAAVCGAVLGDYLIFRFLRDKVFDELNHLFKEMGGSYIKRLFSSPFFIWLIPILGAFIIASPLPDEVGIGLLGLSKVKNWHFVLITFVLNAVGIFLIISLAGSF